MKLKQILFTGAVGMGLMMPDMAIAKPKPLRPKPPKLDAGDNGEAKEDAKGGMRPKIDQANILERLKNARKHRADHLKKAHKKGEKIRHGRKGGFGKLVRDDEKIKALRKAFTAAAKEHQEKVKELHGKLQEASDEEKEALRYLMKGLRKDWFESLKSHREEARTRLKEIREEFKNKRDEVIDANDDDGGDDGGE